LTFHPFYDINTISEVGQSNNPVESEIVIIVIPAIIAPALQYRERKAEPSELIFKAK
jgi:hypothetical protein